MRPETRTALVDRLSPYGTVVEVGVGNRFAVATDLAARGSIVTVTDVRPRSAPPGVSFVRDDVTDPDPAVYRDAGAIYALNLPPELHRPLLEVAAAADTACLFTTLGGDPPAVPAEPEMLPGETVFVAREEPAA